MMSIGQLLARLKNALCIGKGVKKYFPKIFIDIASPRISGGENQ